MKDSVYIISCKKCKYFNESWINKETVLYSCKLNKDEFNYDQQDLSTNKKCYKAKMFRR